MVKNKVLRYIFGIIITVFALATVFLSSSVIFDWFGMREKQGDYVPFIILINFFAGLAYLISAYGFFKAKKWTFLVLTGVAVLLIVGLIFLVLYIDKGGIYKMQTLWAMGFRILLTAVFAIFAYFKIN